MTMEQCLENMVAAYPGKSVFVSLQIASCRSENTRREYRVSVLPGLGEDCTAGYGSTIEEAAAALKKAMNPGGDAIAAMKSKLAGQLAELESITKGE